MPDDLTAELDRISAELRTSGASDEDARRLLAAVEAVLKLADEAEPVARDYGGEPIWWSLTPAEIREAITRELSGDA